ncbi:MAG: radical SAM family heme chaperone HemW [Cytophagales bacterium]|nr:radical SAM family heme chaperone HemW [Cytophagales bacterium]
MNNTTETAGFSDLAADLNQIALKINDREEIPTREEFYTNYPFFKNWKKETNDKLAGQPGINLYIHIPFCIQICDYCFYMKELAKSKSQIDEYVDFLCKEIQLVSEVYGLKRRRVNSIYVGGGTPSILTEVQFKKLIEALHTHHAIDNPEFTFEAEPGTFNRNKLEWYRDHGINRISMGVQSFDDEIIKLSSRKHTARQAIHSIRMVQEADSFQLNIDLLSGLAGETMDSWCRSLDVALAHQVGMLTVYKMKAYANTVFFKKGVHKKEIELPTSEQEIEFMKKALEKIQEAGYHRWTTFAYTHDGHTHAYVENTWRGQDLIAYGVSSFGKIGNVNYQNSNNLPTYYEKINGNAMPLFRTFPLSYKDAIVKEILLCAARLASYKKSEFMEKFGFDYFELIPDTIGQLIDKGYLLANREEVTLTQQGVLFSDYVGRVLAASVKDALGKDSISFTY